MSRSSTRESYDRENGVTDPDIDVPTAEEAPDQVIARRFGGFGPLLSRLFNSGIEARGVERVPETQRDTKNFWNRSVASTFGYVSSALIVHCSLFIWWYAHFLVSCVPYR